LNKDLLFTHKQNSEVSIWFDFVTITSIHKKKKISYFNFSNSIVKLKRFFTRRKQNHFEWKTEKAFFTALLFVAFCQRKKTAKEKSFFSTTFFWRKLNAKFIILCERKSKIVCVCVCAMCKFVCEKSEKFIPWL